MVYVGIVPAEMSGVLVLFRGPMILLLYVQIPVSSAISTIITRLPED